MNDSIAISKAARLEAILKIKKEIEAEEKEIKSFFYDNMTVPTKIFGDVIISLSERSRSNFNLNKFIEENGKDAASPYMNTTHYTSLSAKRA